MADPNAGWEPVDTSAPVGPGVPNPNAAGWEPVDTTPSAGAAAGWEPVDTSPATMDTSPPTGIESAFAAVHPYATGILPPVGAMLTSPMAAHAVEAVKNVVEAPKKIMTGEIPSQAYDPTTGQVAPSPEIQQSAAQLALLISTGEIPGGAEQAFKIQQFLDATDTVKADQFRKQYAGMHEQANKIGPEGQLPAPGAAPTEPTPPPSPVGPFPNAATDGFDFQNFDFATEPPSAPVVPINQPQAPVPQGPFPSSGEPPIPEAAKPPEQVAAENAAAAVPSRAEMESYLIEHLNLPANTFSEAPNGPTSDAQLQDWYNRAKAQPQKPVISGDIEKFQSVLEGTIGKDKLDKILKAAGITPKEALESIARQNNSLELAAASLQKAMQDRDAMSPREKVIAEQQVQALTREFQDRISKLKIDAAKARNDKSGLSTAEKYALAVEEQKAKGAEAAREKILKPATGPKLSVIQGGLPPRKPNPMAMAVPHLPPVDTGTLPTVGLQQAAERASNPTIAATLGEISAAREPDFSVHHAVLPRGTKLEDMSVLDFVSPAGLEASLVRYGEGARVLAGRKGDFPAANVSAKLEDLPLGAHEADRVSGDAAARIDLRAATDSYKMYQNTGDMAWRNKAFNHYADFMHGGGRVEPSRGQGYLLFDAATHEHLLQDVPIGKVPRTSRTSAVYWPSKFDKQGLLYFTQGRAGSVKGKAIDLAKIKNKDEIIALPSAAAYDLTQKGIHPLDATKDDLLSVGIRFTKSDNMGMLEDTQRLLWHQLLYHGDYVGWEEEFANLVERGLRVSVRPDTRAFIITEEAAKGATIPGVNLTRAGVSEIPTTWKEMMKRDILTVKASFPPDIPITPQEKSILNGYVKDTKTILRKAGMNVEVTVSPTDDKLMNELAPSKDNTNVGGFVHWNNDGSATIYLHIQHHYIGGRLEELQLRSSLGHEIGHIIFEYTWADQPFEVQDQILAAHDRMQLGLGISPSYLDATRLSGSIVDFATVAPQPISPSFANYWGGLHEFFARGAERHMMSELQYGGSMGKFFGVVSRRLNVLFNQLAQHDPNLFQPAIAIKEYIDNLGKVPVQNTILGEINNQAMQASMERSGKLALPGVEHPKTAQTVNAKVMFNRVWGPKGPGPEFDGDSILKGVNWLSWLTRTGLSMPDLAGHNSHIPGTMGYVDTLRVWNNYESEQNAFRVEPRLKAWHDLGPTRGDKLSKFIFYISQQEYRTPFEKQTGVSRKPYKAEMAAAMTKFGMDYDILQVFDGVTGDLKDFLLRNGQVWADEAKRVFTDEKTGRITNPVALQKELDAIDADVAQLLKAPYFPQTRFGTYAVDVKDSAGNRVDFQLFETAKERDAAGPAMRAKYPRPQYTINANMTMDDTLRPFVGMPARLLETVRDRLDLAKYPDLKEQFEALMFNLGPTQSFRKHMLAKENVPGFSTDAMRVYADYMLHGNKMLGRAKFRWQAQKQVNKIFEYASRMRSKDTTIRLGQYFQHNLDAMINPGNDYVALRSATFMWMLGGVVKTAAMNLFQMPLTVFPHLAKVYGGLKGPKEVVKAINVVAKNWNQILTNPNFKEDPLMAASRRQAYKEGTLRDGMAAEVANVATNRQFAKYNGNDVLKRKAYNLMYGMGVMFSWTESFGRHVAFEAARRLAMQGLNPAHVDKIVADNIEHYNRLNLDMGLSWTDQQIRGHLAATHAVRTTYFDTGAWARPKLLRGAWGVVPFTFFTFFRAIFHFQLTQPGGFLSLLVGAFLYGYMGGPGMEDLNNLVKQIAGWVFGKDLDMDREARYFLKTMFGKDSNLPELMAHGLSSEGFGIPLILNRLGIPSPNFDTSGSLSEGRIIPGVSNLDIRGHNKSFAEGVGDMVLGSLGATVQTVGRFLQAIAAPANFVHDPKQAEFILPNVLKYPFRAVRHAITGQETNAAGAVVTKFDVKSGSMSSWNDRLSLLFEALGFTPAKLSQEQRVEHSQIEAANFWKGQRILLNESLQQAFDSRDGPAISEAMKNISIFNIRVARLGMGTYVIKPQTRIQAAKQTAIKRALLNQGLAPNKMDIPSSQQTRSIFGTGTVIDSKKTR